MERRTALITAASIAGVVLTGATAIGANIGILDRADNSGIGQLSAVTESVEPTREPDRADVGTAPSTSTPYTQSFSVESAGTVDVSHEGDALRVAEVTPSSGWEWALDQAADDAVAVTFSSPTATYRFDAGVDADGNLVASVSQPTPATEYEGEHEYEDEDYEDDEYEDDEYEDEDYDDDEYEHEGRDDDD